MIKFYLHIKSLYQAYVVDSLTESAWEKSKKLLRKLEVMSQYVDTDRHGRRIIKNIKIKSFQTNLQ